jgi:hypothetical protein
MFISNQVMNVGCFVFEIISREFATADERRITINDFSSSAYSVKLGNFAED